MLTPRPPRVHYRTLISDSSRWERFEMRPSDIVISTPAKCGTTWTQMMCALLVFQTPELELPLDSSSPWLDMMTRSDDEVFGILDAQTHRRFIKTHTPLDGLPIEPGVTYLSVGRDPRDVALSMVHHHANMIFEKLIEARLHAVGLDDVADLLAGEPPPDHATEVDAVRYWIDRPEPVTDSGSCLRLLVHHLGTFWPERDDARVHLMHYDDLQDDLDASLRRLAAVLGIEVAPDRWSELVAAATFASMKSRAAHLVPDSSHAIWRDPDDFFKVGVTGMWRELLDEADQAHYRTTIEALAPPDLVTWLHHGRTD